jgi:rRNA maturation endonuclease Nob1
MKSNSVKMKICINCSSPMSEDSEFCANCGQKFEEKTNLTGGAKRFYYTSDGKKKERS